MSWRPQHPKIPVPGATSEPPETAVGFGDPWGSLPARSILQELRCKALIQHLTLDHVDVSGVDGGCQHLDVDIAVPQLGHLQILQPGQGDTKEKRALTPKEKGINTTGKWHQHQFGDAFCALAEAGECLYHPHTPPKLTALYAPSH